MHDRSRIRVESTLESVRATQLYRTLLHEIGHLVDYAAKVPDGYVAAGIRFEALNEMEERYWQRPGREREEFAHRYADEMGERLRASGVIPFPRIESWDSDGLRRCDFA